MSTIVDISRERMVRIYTNLALPAIGTRVVSILDPPTTISHDGDAYRLLPNQQGYLLIGPQGDG